MAKGQPDFGAYAPTETIVGISDLGELAARLGSIDTFDRRGNVLLMEDFEGSLAKLQYYTKGTGAAVKITNTNAKSSDFCCQLTTGNKTNDYTEIYFRRAYPTLSKMGFEFSFDLFDNVKYIGIWARLYTGEKLIEGEFYYYYANGKWYYKDGVAGDTPLEPVITIEKGLKIWHTVKMVLDFTTNKYCRVIFDNNVWDIPQATLSISDSTTPPYLSLIIYVYASANANQVAYLDDVILTQNEP